MNGCRAEPDLLRGWLLFKGSLFSVGNGLHFYANLLCSLLRPGGVPVVL
jgi:hypothetical protein